jgi:Rrf2 family protein
VTLRITAKTDYALRAMAHLAAERPGTAVPAERIAREQDISPKYLLVILNELKRARLVRSMRGPEGGYLLSRAPREITLGDVIRAVEGPLADVHDESLGQLTYAGPAEGLREVWEAVRGSLRSVLDVVSLADLASGTLPASVRKLAASYRAQTSR